jgi:integrase
MIRERRYSARPRHPLTHKAVRVSASSRRELDAMVAHINLLRTNLRIGAMSAADVDKALRRMTHGPITLERAALAYIEREDLAGNTRRRVLSFLATAGAQLAHEPLEALEAPVVSRWIERLRARMSDASVGVAWRTLRAVARFAAVRGWIGGAPWGIWRPKLRSSPAREPREAARDVGELAALLDAARALDAEDGSKRLPQREAKIAATALLGLRQGELAGLRWPDFDELRLCVRIARKYDGAPVKSRRIQVLAAPPALFEVLERHRARLLDAGLYDPTGPVFPSERESAPGRPRAYSQGECLTRSVLRAVVVRAGLPSPARWSPHSLRDTFATLEERGHAGDLRALAQRTRHDSIASLVRYLRSRTRQLAPPGFTLDGAQAPAALPPAPRAGPGAPK